MEASESGETPPLRTSANGEEYVSSAEEVLNLASSKGFDPDINTVIQWHLSLCPICDPSKPNATFGQPVTNYCPEYWEIVKDYADYEVKYAWQGNP